MKTNFYIKETPHIKTRGEILEQQQRILMKVGFTKLQATTILLVLHPVDLDYVETKLDERLGREQENKNEID